MRSRRKYGLMRLRELEEKNAKLKQLVADLSFDKQMLQDKIVAKEITILIMEDNEDLRKYILKFLQNYYTVLFAENGVWELEILKTKNVELVISDVMMPQMDGFEFCQTIKSQIETSHIPIFLLTALSSNENTTIVLDKGADTYI